MKKILLVIFFFCSTQAFSQRIIKHVGGSYCDCWDSYEDRTSLPGSSLWKARYIISWNAPEEKRQKRKARKDDEKSHNDCSGREVSSNTCNYLLELYWCGCENGGGESIIQNRTYYKNGKKHRKYEYDKSGNIVFKKCWDDLGKEIDCEE